MLKKSIACFAYTRLDHLQQLLVSLSRCPEFSTTPVFVFSDAPRTETRRAEVDAVRAYLQGFAATHRNVTMVARSQNLGVDRNVREGVTFLLTEGLFDTVTGLEDDLVVSPEFLKYSFAALEVFAGDQRVGKVAGFSFPQAAVPRLASRETETFFSFRQSSYGWSTWKDRWLSLDWAIAAEPLRESLDRFAVGEDIRQLARHRGPDGVIEFWDVAYCLSLVRRLQVTVFPTRSLVYNAGFDGTGVHAQMSYLQHQDRKAIEAQRAPVRIEPLDTQGIDFKLLREIAALYRPTWVQRMKIWVRERITALR